MRRSLNFVIMIALIAAIIWSVGDLREVGRVLATVKWELVALGLAVVTVDRLLMSYKWGILLQAQGAQLPLMRLTQIYCTAMVWGLFLPMTVGADGIRIYLASRAGLNGHVVVASVVIERMLGFVASLIFGLLGLVILRAGGFLDSEYDVIFVFGVLALVVTLVGFILSLRQTSLVKLMQWLPRRLTDSRLAMIANSFHKTYAEYSGKRRELRVFFFLTLGEQLLSPLFSWVIALAVHVNPGLLFMVGIIPLAILVSRLPISFDGIGVIEGSLIVLMSLVGIPPAETLAFAIAARLIQIVAWCPWWLSYMLESGEARTPRRLPRD